MSHRELLALVDRSSSEEQLSLPPEQRETLAKLLLESLAGNSKTDAEIQTQWRTRLDDLKSGRDHGQGFGGTIVARRPVNRS